MCLFNNVWSAIGIDVYVSSARFVQRSESLYVSVQQCLFNVRDRCMSVCCLVCVCVCFVLGMCVQRSESLYVSVQHCLVSVRNRCMRLVNNLCSTIGIAVCVCSTRFVHRSESMYVCCACWVCFRPRRIPNPDTRNMHSYPIASNSSSARGSSNPLMHTGSQMESHAFVLDCLQLIVCTRIAQPSDTHGQPAGVALHSRANRSSSSLIYNLHPTAQSDQRAQQGHLFSANLKAFVTSPALYLKEPDDAAVVASAMIFPMRSCVSFGFNSASCIPAHPLCHA